MRFLCDYYILSIGNPYPFLINTVRQVIMLLVLYLRIDNNYDLHIVFYFYHIAQATFFPCLKLALGLQLIPVHVLAAGVNTDFMRHLLERMYILQVLSLLMVTTMEIILSKVSQFVMDNHFSSTTA
jgi:hypothetical protein